MRHKYRIKTAWLSYVGIQIFWALCVLLVPIAVGLHPSKLWAIPFCCVTIAGGMHLTVFRHEYNALLRKACHIIPYAKYVTPAQQKPKYFVPLGIAYTCLGVLSLLLVLFSRI